MSKYYIEKSEDNFEKLNTKDKNKLLKWIKENFIPIKSTNYKCGTSYGLKHLIQYQEGLYVTNEQFKKAMLLCGFKPGNPYNRNWNFNISQKSKAFIGGNKNARNKTNLQQITTKIL